MTEKEQGENLEREGKQNTLLSCNQSLFGGSTTGSWSNVVRIEKERRNWQRSVCVCVCLEIVFHLSTITSIVPDTQTNILSGSNTLIHTFSNLSLCSSLLIHFYYLS